LSLTMSTSSGQNTSSTSANVPTTNKNATTTTTTNNVVPQPVQNPPFNMPTPDQVMQMMEHIRKLEAQMQKQEAYIQNVQNATPVPQCTQGSQIDEFTFDDNAAAQISDTMNNIMESKMDVLIPQAFNSLFTTVLTNQQRNVSKTIHNTLNKINFKACKFVNKQTGERCTTHPCIDRKTGKESKYCYKHKYMCEKNDQIKFLNMILTEQPELIRRETESQRQERQERRSRRSSRSAGPSPNVTTYNSPTTPHKPANPQLLAKTSVKDPAIDKDMDTQQ